MNDVASPATTAVVSVLTAFGAFVGSMLKGVDCDDGPGAMDTT